MSRLEDYLDYGETALQVCSQDFWTVPLCPPDYDPAIPRRDPAALRAMPYADYLLTREWKEVRREALKCADGHCDQCRASGPLHVHHLSYEHLGNEPLEDLQVLCPDCHRAAHGITV